MSVDLSSLITSCADTISAHADELTALDQAIGDGDHGLNMKRGFEAVRGEAGALAGKPMPEALKAIGMKLVMTVGGASGPLFGTLFMTLGKEWPADPDRASLAATLRKAIDAVAARGKSQTGQKTLLDVLEPVQAALAQGRTPSEIAAIADGAAEATKPVKAIRGRASFLGDRSIGHVDPGARSAALLVRAVAQTLEPAR
ncbi:MAG: dihydroxyacetone kinase subunit L [Rhizobiaceae bacterium]|nr:dihydroxyacetone kinase subunit L [Rhizobiaceae bacterium]